MLKFLSADIWKNISQLTKKSAKNKVAVAYFGKGASEQLPLKKDDILVIAMGLDNVRCGQVSPYEVEKLFNKGVKIYTVTNLHSKVYLFDNAAIVGSANASSFSQTHLIESGILTNDKKTLREIEKFILDRCIEKVEKDYIELCKANYSPPKLSEIKGKKVPKRPTNQLSNLWIISTRLVNYTDDDLEVIERDKRVFEAKITHRRIFEVSEIMYPASNRFINQVREGDLIIELRKHKIRVQVLKPKRALGVTFNKRNGKAYLRVEERKKPAIRSWTEFERALKSEGIHSIRKNSTKLIKNDTLKEALLQFFK